MTLKTPAGNIHITHETVTPDLAAKYLATNTLNRRPRPRQVEILKRDLQSGTWRLSHQGIAFGTSGRLLDGQHRLLAIQQSGIPAELLVFRDMPEDTQEFVDTNAARSVAENLQLLDGITDAAKVAAYCNALAHHWCGFKLKVSLPQTRKILTLFPKIKLLAAADTPRIPPVYRRVHYLAPAALALHIDTKKAADFFDAFTLGKNLTEGHPALLLRDHAVRAFTGPGSARTESFHRALDCTAAHLLGRTITSLKEYRGGNEYFQTTLAKKYTQLREILHLT